jgi:serine protease Do
MSFRCPAAFVRHLLLMLSLAMALGGCASSTQLLFNDKASAEIKSKSYKDYTDILFIAPREDSRKIAPRTMQALESLGFKVGELDTRRPIDSAQGSGFLISADGRVLTCDHVLDGGVTATVIIEGRRYFADVVKADAARDLALLQLRERPPEGTAVLGFRPVAKGYAMGEDVFTIGFPLNGLLGQGSRVTKGLVSAAAGMHDDPLRLQVSAEVQPGNSGGPLLDRDGQVIGIVQQTINPWRSARAAMGTLAQNINFTLKADPVLEFLKGADLQAFASIGYENAGGLDRASRGVVKIVAGIQPNEATRRDTMVVALSYASQWDLWWRFNLFQLLAFDRDTQEQLFAVGQGGDNKMSTEESVMKVTVEQFRKAVAQH